MVKQWGFVRIPQPTFNVAMRSDFLIGYPASLATVVVIITPTFVFDTDYLRYHLSDPTTILQPAGSITMDDATYEDLDYIKRYL